MDSEIVLHWKRNRENNYNDLESNIEDTVTVGDLRGEAVEKHERPGLNACIIWKYNVPAGLNNIDSANSIDSMVSSREELKKDIWV